MLVNLMRVLRLGCSSSSEHDDYMHTEATAFSRRRFSSLIVYTYDSDGSSRGAMLGSIVIYNVQHLLQCFLFPRLSRIFHHSKHFRQE